ncbi:MAG: histidine kinase N-terminal 7TM domain-containing diguanylate cyclase [Aminivibrio sp.]|jgi:diguanylate cyclase (GGDEF)-like protein
MDWFEVYRYFLYAVIIVNIGLFLYSILSLEGALSSIYSLFCLASAAYVLGAALQFTSAWDEGVFFGQRIKYFGAASFLCLNFLFAYKVRYRKKLNPLAGFAVFLIPLLSLVLVNTNDFHGLYYSGIKYMEYGGRFFARRVPGPLYYPMVLYSFLIMAFNLYAFFPGWRRGGYGVKNPHFLLTTSWIMPIAILIAYQKEVTPFWVDLLPAGLLVVSFMYLTAIKKYRALEIGEVYGREIFSSVKEGLMLLSPEGGLLEYNNSAGAVFGWLNERNLYRPLHELDSRFNVAAGHREFRISQGSGRDEKIYEFRLTELLEDGELMGYLYVFMDVTENIRLIERLKYMADHDSLTELYNRRRILRELEGLIARRTEEKFPFSLLMIDIDHFKGVNDGFGHTAGNEVLKQVAAACVEVVAPEGMAGRYGGEEFLILLPGTSGKKALEVAERLRSHIQRLPLIFSGRPVSITISVGVMDAGPVRREDLRIDYLVSRADEAMYRAKNGGRNQVALYEPLPAAWRG